MRYLAGLVYTLLVALTWGFWREQATDEGGVAFDQRTTTTAYVFGVVPYLQHDEFGTRLDWRGVCLGGVSTAVFSLLLVRVASKRKDPGEAGRA